MERPGNLLAPYIRKITKDFKDDGTIKISMRKVFSIKYNFSYTRNDLIVECEYTYKSFERYYSASTKKVFSSEIRDLFKSKNVSEVVINLQEMYKKEVSVFDFVFSDLWNVVQTINIKTPNGVLIEYCPNIMISDQDYHSKWKDAGYTTEVMPNWESVKNSLYNYFYGDLVIQDSGNGTFTVSSETYDGASSKNLPKDYLNACYLLLKGLLNVKSLEKQANRINSIIVLNHCCNDKILYRLLGNGEYSVIVSFK